MIRTEHQRYIFQHDWTGHGERGIRDFLLIPAIFFGAVSPGYFLASMFMDYAPGVWAAIVLNFIGYGVTHLLYLGRMERFWRAALNFRTSWISRGFLFNAIFSGFGFLYALSLSNVFGLAHAGGTFKVIAGISAMAFAGYPGFMLMTIKAIPFWRSKIEPVIFFLQGILGGTALLFLTFAIVPAPSESAAVGLLKFNFMLTLVVFTLLMGALLQKALHGGAEEASVDALTRGEFSPPFIWGAVVLGLVVPLLTLGLGLTYFGFGPVMQMTSFAIMLMELAGVYLAKYGILRAGVYTPLV